MMVGVDITFSYTYSIFQVSPAKLNRAYNRCRTGISDEGSELHSNHIRNAHHCTSGRVRKPSHDTHDTSQEPAVDIRKVL